MHGTRSASVLLGAMRFRVVLSAICLSGCVSNDFRLSMTTSAAPVRLTLNDVSRQRPLTVLLYGASKGRPKPLAIVSHGYGGHDSDYSFIALDLVGRGYVVASIEHSERPGDPPMANSGDLAKLRRPVWQIGVDNIGFVIGEMTRKGFADQTRKPIIIGHSNGGDMTMLFATEHPEAIRIALSLDNRRMPMPRTSQPKVCSIRSSNFVADPGVLPSLTEQQALGMLIVAVPVKHDDMWDGGTPEQRSAILKVIEDCIDNHARQ